MSTLELVVLVATIVLFLSIWINLKTIPDEGEMLKGIKGFWNEFSSSTLIISIIVIAFCGVLRFLRVAK